MKDIKTKEVTTKPKTKNPASRIPKELMRTAILESKEKSQTIANARDNDMGEQSPSEYASGKVASAEEWAARKSGRTVTSAGKTAAQTSYEKIKLRVTGKKEAEKEAARGTGDTQAPDPVSREAPEQKNREQTSENVKIKSREAQEAQIKDVQIQKAKRQKAVSDAVKTKEQKIRVARETPRIQNGQELSGTKQFSIRDQSRKKAVADTARQNAIRQKQPETIRIKEKPRKQLEPKTIQRRTIKTAPPSAKISIQPEQKLRVASSNALTTRMQKQMERRAAKQAAKKAALQTSDGIRRIQKTARAGENTFKAARAAVEVVAKTVQSMIAALGAAGAVMVLLLVIMVGIIGGAAFSGSSESNEALSQEVLSYTATIQKYANQYGIPEYVSVIQAIMMQESGGRGTDPMQSSECPYNTRYSNSPNAIQDADYSMRGNEAINAALLEGRDCYAGLDLSSTGDITALVLIFPPRDKNEKYVLLPYFWIPEETIPRRVKANSVPYDIWEKQGYIMATEGNVIHYNFIEKFIMDLSEKYHILEIAVDRWNATQMIQNLEGEGFTIVPFGQGFSSMSAPTKEFYRLLMEGRIIHGGNPVLRWMAGNVVIDTDPAGNIKVTKAKSKEKIDGIVAAIMALDRCIRQEGQSGSVYDERGLLVF